jgi:TRAP-type C4-dicarboxylate transport system permease small subunit
MRSQTLALVLLFCILAPSFILCDSDPSVGEAADKAQDPPVDRSNYPYGRNTFAQSGSSVSFGENQALAVPSWVLYIILVGFVAITAYVVRKIFELQTNKEEKKRLKEEKRSKKASSIKSKTS